MCQNRLSVVWICNYTPHLSVGCNYLSMQQIPGSGARFHIYVNVIRQTECTCKKKVPRIDPDPFKLCAIISGI